MRLDGLSITTDVSSNPLIGLSDAPAVRDRPPDGILDILPGPAHTVRPVGLEREPRRVIQIAVVDGADDLRHAKRRGGVVAVVCCGWRVATKHGQTAVE